MPTTPTAAGCAHRTPHRQRGGARQSSTGTRQSRHANPDSTEPTKMKVVLSLVAAIAPLALLIPTAPSVALSGSCSSKVLHYSSAGPPPVDRWVVSCTGDACCSPHDGSSSEIAHYKFCSCDENDNKCCHIVVVTNGGPPPSGIGKAAFGDCSAQNTDCPNGTTCKEVTASVEPPWQEGWTSACQ